ncbi:MAG: hypothetical protein RL518_1944 [Pseudomonadota bacterium]|jgi:uncharacterized membrane protein
MPLAFIVMLSCIELLRIRPGWRETLRVSRAVALVAVVVSTGIAFLSGYQASSPLGDLAPDIQGALGTHHAYGRLLLINALLMGTFAWLESRALRGGAVLFLLYLVTLFVQAGLTLLVGYLGGELVFTHGIGRAVTM